MASYFELVDKLQTQIDALDIILGGHDRQTVIVAGQVKNSISKQFAESLATAVQLAVDAAGDIDAVRYSSTSVGMQNTSYGQYFSVVSGNDEEYLRLYKNDNGGLYDTGKIYPTIKGVLESVKQRLSSPTIIGSNYSNITKNTHGQFSGTTAANENSYIKVALDETVYNGDYVQLTHITKVTGTNAIVWLANGANTKMSDHQTLASDIGVQTVQLRATGTATHAIIQQLTTKASTLDTIFNFATYESKMSNILRFFELFAVDQQGNFEQLNDDVVSFKDTFNNQISGFQNTLKSVDDSFSTLFGEIDYSNEIHRDFDQIEINHNRIIGTIPAGRNAYTRFGFINPVKKGQKIKVSYVLNATGNGVLIWLNNEAAANLSGGTTVLSSSGSVETVELTATDDAPFITIQQVTNQPSSIDITLMATNEESPFNGSLEFTKQAMNTQKSVIESLVDTVESALGSNQSPIQDGTPLTSGYSEFVANENSLDATILASGNGYTAWSFREALQKDEEITLYYQLAVTGNAPKIWLSNEAFQDKSGGTFSLISDGSLHTITLKATDVASRLVIQQYTTQLSTVKFNFLAFLGGVGSKSSQKTVLDLFQSSFDSQADALVNMQYQLNDMQNQIIPSDSFINRYLLSARNGVMVTTTGNSSQSIRRTYTNGAVAVKNLEMALANWHVTPDGEQLPDNDELRLRVSIEYPIGSKPTHLKVDGSDSLVIPAGRTIVAKDLSGLIIPAGEKFYVHTFVSAYKDDSLTGRLPVGRFYVHWSQNRDMYEKNGTDLTDQSGGQSTGTAAPADLYSHLTLTGESIYNDRKPSLLIVGDSISYGFNEHLAMKGDNTGAVGPYERWAAANGVGAFNLSVPSKKASNWAGFENGAYPRLSAVLNGFTNSCVLALGRNDLANQTAEELIESIDSIKRFLISKYGITSIPITVTPASSSSDSWATVENQAANGNDAARIAYNDYVRGLDSFLEITNTIESSNNSGKWKAGSLTSDGVHPSTNAVETIVSAMPAVDSLF